MRPADRLRSASPFISMPVSASSITSAGFQTSVAIDLNPNQREVSPSASVAGHAAPMEVKVLQDIPEIYGDEIELDMQVPFIENYETGTGE